MLAKLDVETRFRVRANAGADKAARGLEWLKKKQRANAFKD